MTGQTGQAQLTRRRDSADSRDRLLTAAGELFAERGYERTTVRDIGQRAEVDPAMIARYFGSKAALYLACIRRDMLSAGPADITTPDVLRALLDRAGARGPTPTFYAAVHPHEDEDVQTAALDVLTQRMIAPSRARAEDNGLAADAQLRAEIVTAAFAGVVLSRTSGAFATLAAAPSAEVAELMAQLINRLLQPDEA